MSIDLFVIFAKSEAPSGEAWARALAKARVPVAFVQPIDISRDSGFVPMKVYGRASGFEFGIDSYAELASVSAAVAGIQRTDPVVYSLHFGAKPDECVAAMLSAAVLVSKFNGVAFDPQGGMVLTEIQLRDGAKACHSPSGS